MEPHHKNRSRAQEVVVVACFELDQPELAVGFATQIADWRRASAFADYAWVVARRGDTKSATHYLQLAEEFLANQRKDESAQEWRSDLIALKLSRAWHALGDSERATSAAKGIDLSSAHAVDASWAETTASRADAIDCAQASTEVAQIDAGWAGMSLGQQATALRLLTRLHERCYADAKLRAAIEERPAQRFATLAPGLRLSALASMARVHVAHGNVPGAKSLLTTMRDIVDGHRWQPTDRLPTLATLIELTAASGEPERARQDLEQALASYHTEREAIVNIDRAEALRPLALAAFALGDTERGAALLEQVFEEALINPNSRPRCDDLVDTLVAMAKRRIAPTPTQWTRIREIVAGLGLPW
jgi:tetratricopeptide (TPR) repeat protein